MIRYATLFFAGVILLLALAFTDALILPITALVLGFMFLGYAFPELISNLTPYSKTLWMPLGFVVSAVIGTWLVFNNKAFEVLMGAQYCSIAPCIPIGLIIIAFVLGSLAKFGTLKLAGEKLDLFGENIKD